MRFENRKVLLTPQEEGFCEKACRFQGMGSLADAVKLKMMAGMIDWANSLEPPVVDDIIQGESRYVILKVHATERWKLSDGETIEVELSDEELEKLKERAKHAVEEAQERACNINRNYKAGNLLMHLSMLPEASDEFALSEDEEESLKGQQFEDEIERIFVGENIVAAITEFQA